jgi:hypothetical protein
LFAVRGWQFNPATHAGVAVASEVTIPLEFRIDGYTPPPAAEGAPAPAADTNMLAGIVVTGNAP